MNLRSSPVGWFFTLCFSAAEVSLISVRRSKLKDLIDRGNKAAATAERLSEDPNDIAAVSEFGRAITGFIAVASAVVLYLPALTDWIGGAQFPLLVGLRYVLALLIVVLSMSLVILVLGRFLPRRLAHQYPEAIALSLAPVFQLYAVVAWPFVMFLVRIANWIAGRVGQPGTGRRLELPRGRNPNHGGRGRGRGRDRGRRKGDDLQHLRVRGHGDPRDHGPPHRCGGGRGRAPR